MVGKTKDIGHKKFNAKACKNVVTKMNNKNKETRRCEACNKPTSELNAKRFIAPSQDYKMMNGRPECILQDGVWVNVQSSNQQSLPVAVVSTRVYNCINL